MSDVPSNTQVDPKRVNLSFLMLDYMRKDKQGKLKNVDVLWGAKIQTKKKQQLKQILRVQPVSIVVNKHPGPGKYDLQAKIRERRQTEMMQEKQEMRKNQCSAIVDLPASKVAGRFTRSSFVTP